MLLLCEDLFAGGYNRRDTRTATLTRLWSRVCYADTTGATYTFCFCCAAAAGYNAAIATSTAPVLRIPTFLLSENIM